MNSPENTDTSAEAAPDRSAGVTVLAREAGVSFQPSLGNACGVGPAMQALSE
jgi:hypothetical protein